MQSINVLTCAQFSTSLNVMCQILTHAASLQNGYGHCEKALFMSANCYMYESHLLLIKDIVLG